MNTTPPVATIIIPTFNRSDLTKQCLSRLFSEQSAPPREVIVVDNASTDDTVQMVKSFPDVRLYRNETNENFSGACNRGAGCAGSPNLIFLNNDTIPFDGWMDPLLDELQKGAGAVGSKLVFPDNTIQHAGVAFMRETRFPYHPYRGMSGGEPCVNHRRSIQVVTGACLATPKELFDNVGGFSPRYRNGGEDIDYCLKVRKASKEVIYRHDSVLIHLESQSPGRMDYNQQNVEVFFEMWPDALLSDEDRFYFEDGLHRVGDRHAIDLTELAKFRDEKERGQWQGVALLQNGFEVWGFNQEQYPSDAAVLEWVGFVARKRGRFELSAGLFAKACQIRAFLAIKKSQQEFTAARLSSNFVKFLQ